MISESIVEEVSERDRKVLCVMAGVEPLQEFLAAFFEPCELFLRLMFVLVDLPTSAEPAVPSAVVDESQYITQRISEEQTDLVRKVIGHHACTQMIDHVIHVPAVVTQSGKE